ncbi:uncharacterized protein LOC114328193 [Diabrotica virgifera virgifera]|uniref:Uncharacterized protein LOC114328193 n=1 Tax=Diabrotica virgifera virgifera TaxID=50390 RepID=A0A6P7FI82_DIAVI|nr:uncharacterized protein LOC114328193 [Diabrotica virgifera virgifera]
MEDYKEDKMESWLVDVKRVHIPRPKFGSGSRCGYSYPTEPPKDYINEDARDDFKYKGSPANMNKATEDIRRALQKL